MFATDYSILAVLCFASLREVSKYGVFPGPYFPVFGTNSVHILENTDQKKLRIWTLFTQWQCESIWTNRKSFILHKWLV